MQTADIDFTRLHRPLVARYGEREARAIVRLVLDEAFGVRPVDIYAGKVRKFSQDERPPYSSPGPKPRSSPRGSRRTASAPAAACSTAARGAAAWP